MAWEATRPSVDARRALLSRLVLDHRLSAPDPLAPASFDWEGEAAELIFADRKVSLSDVAAHLEA
jgi:acyl-CoA dehydrogenase